MGNVVDINNIIPDSWLSRGLDAAGTVFLFMLRGAHQKFENQTKVMQDMVTEHAVFKANINNLTETVSKVEENTNEIMRILIKGKSNG